MITVRYFFQFIILFLIFPVGSESQGLDQLCTSKYVKLDGVTLLILGNVQDAGSPHIACKKKCCKSKFKKSEERNYVVSLGLIDQQAQKKWLFEATPDISFQLNMLTKHCEGTVEDVPDGIFITHAHIGHYSGLMYLGREGMNASNVSVYALPRMNEFLSSNGPWDQLKKLKNISLELLVPEQEKKLNERISIQAMIVPHRDEYSETAGFVIKGPNKKVLFIPDIDKWEKWSSDIKSVIESVDYAFIDGTFYSENELPGRKMEEIPHPFIQETMNLFESESESFKSKIFFIHLNHSNPVLNPKSKESKRLMKRGFHVARTGMSFLL